MTHKRLTFVGIVIFLYLLYLVSKTNIGNHIIFYSLLLILVFDLTANKNQIQSVMLTDAKN